MIVCFFLQGPLRFHFMLSSFSGSFSVSFLACLLSWFLIHFRVSSQVCFLLWSVRTFYPACFLAGLLSSSGWRSQRLIQDRGMFVYVYQCFGLSFSFLKVVWMRSPQLHYPIGGCPIRLECYVALCMLHGKTKKRSSESRRRSADGSRVGACKALSSVCLSLCRSISVCFGPSRSVPFCLSLGLRLSSVLSRVVSVCFGLSWSVLICLGRASCVTVCLDLGLC